MAIITEGNNESTFEIDLMSGFEIVQLINNEDKKVALAVEKELLPISKAVDLIASAFLKGGRLAYFGAGTSGRIAVLDAAEWMPTFGVEEGMVKAYIAGGDKALRCSVENAEDNASFGMSDLSDFNPGPYDVVVGISASGNPKYVLSALKAAKQKGASTIGITSNPDAKLKELSDIFICPIVGPEVLRGSSRMKSGTAQKMILNMLSTGAMIKIGKTYHNYMIDVRILSEKLYERGCRFISEICSIDEKESAYYLNESGEKVKTACVMKLKNCTKEQAEKMLQDVDGVLRKVIG